MIPSIVIQAAFLIVLIRSAFCFIQHVNRVSTVWLELLYHLSMAILALWFLLRF